MRVIRLTSRTNENWRGKLVDEQKYDELINENCTVLKPDGTPLLVLLKQAIQVDTAKQAWSVLKTYHCENKNRGSASGTAMISIISKDKHGNEYMSKTRMTPKGFAVDSGAIGFLERTPRVRHCRACYWNRDNPDKFVKVIPLSVEVSNLFKEHVPSRWQLQMNEVQKTRPDYIIPGTVFTTITVNKNFRTACHKDAGDLPDGFTAMTVFRTGSYAGGHLVLPDFRTAVQLDNRDLILFDPHEYHGNTQIAALSKDYTRCSLVFYYRKKMVNCLSLPEEFESAKRVTRGPVFPGIEDEEETSE